MEFNEFLGPENAEREYKLGVMYWSRDFEMNQLILLLKTGKWMFNDCTHNTIKLYLEKYLSKYITAFTNNLSSVNSGTLYIGVDDNGYVKGIPYRGELSLMSIVPIVNKVIDKMMSFSNNRIASYLRNNIKFEILKVNFDTVKHKTDDIDQYNHFLKAYHKRKAMLDKYHEYKKKWCNIIASNTEKLYKNLNKERHIFAQYSRDNEILTKKKYKHKYSHLEYLCDVPDYYDLIANLKIKEFTFIPGYKIKKCRSLLQGNETDLHSSEINDVITHYVFGRYKDFCIASYKHHKPIQPKVSISDRYPKFLLSQIDKMIHPWMANNRLMNLYVIKITVPSGFLNNGEKIMYYNLKKRKYESCFRTIDNNMGPTTVSC